MAGIPTVKGIDSATMAALAGQSNATADLEALKKQDVSTEKEKAKALKGFEALMLHQMLKSMWETVEHTDLMGENGNEASIYRDMLNQAVSDSIAEGRGIGLKKVLNHELDRKTAASKKIPGLG